MMTECMSRRKRGRGVELGDSENERESVSSILWRCRRKVPARSFVYRPVLSCSERLKKGTPFQPVESDAQLLVEVMERAGDAREVVSSLASQTKGLVSQDNTPLRERRVLEYQTRRPLFLLDVAMFRVQLRQAGYQSGDALVDALTRPLWQPYAGYLMDNEQQKTEEPETPTDEGKQSSGDVGMIERKTTGASRAVMQFTPRPPNSGKYQDRTRQLKITDMFSSQSSKPSNNPQKDTQSSSSAQDLGPWTPWLAEQTVLSCLSEFQLDGLYQGDTPGSSMEQAGVQLVCACGQQQQQQRGRQDSGSRWHTYRPRECRRVPNRRRKLKVCAPKPAPKVHPFFQRSTKSQGSSQSQRQKERTTQTESTSAPVHAHPTVWVRHQARPRMLINAEVWRDADARLAVLTDANKKCGVNQTFISDMFANMSLRSGK